MPNLPGIIQTDPNLERRRQLAQAMMQQGASSAPVQHWSQGANRILQSLLGAYNMRQAEQEQARQQGMGRENLALALNELQSQTPASQPMTAGEGGDQIQFDLGQRPQGDQMTRFAQQLAANPYTQDFGTQLALQQQVSQQQAQQAQKDELAQIKAKQGGGGQFQGTGVEQQMLNIILDPNIPEGDPRKQLARQRLGRPTTTVTPQGTYIQPGYDVDAATGQQRDGQQGDPRQGFMRRPLTNEQERKLGARDRMTNAQQELNKLGDYDPTATGEFLRGLTNISASEENQRYKQAASDWVRAKLRWESGAVISPDEMEKEFQTYFPVYGDSDEVIEQKARSRRQAEQIMIPRDTMPDAQPAAPEQPQLQGRRSGRSDLRKPAIASPQTDADYNALPSGAVYIDPDDGKHYRKP